MKYAIIENGIVTNVALAGGPMAQNWVETDTAGIGWTYENGVFAAPVIPEPPVVVDPCEWLIDHMPLLDRFGPAIRHLFLKSTDTDVVALRLDYFARKWLDLRHADLQGGFYFMAGVTVPILGTITAPIAGLTPAMVASVFATKALPTENEWLRSQLFPK